MSKETLSPTLPGKLAVLGLAYNVGSPKPYRSGLGSDRYMATHPLACRQTGGGHHLPGIFPGLFTRKDPGKKPPTQNVYLIKSVSLLSKPPGS
ncbi:MAG: hypothetical protein HOA72_22915 [Desulfobacula sp.]|jgi:hypothetical protein|uniref:hypothetical protein n=1 Tax=Desulfobacula sp. TaxID=2593537 RepID=UPI001D441AE2|nr:hypothetical protein [Candidatus Neomarinimicrobiota bacterium]MBT6751772.1 hypothetical protein [Desulfobacula sp.]